MLVGTSLIVIIPEGVETLYSSSLASHQHRLRALTEHSFDVRRLRSFPAFLARGNENLDAAVASVVPETAPDAADANPPTSHIKMTRCIF